MPAAPARRHEVVEPLVAAIGEFGLSRAHFDRIIDARERDLADTPPADLAALVDYAEGTSAALLIWRWRRSGPPSRERSRPRARSGSPMRSPGYCGRCRSTPLPAARYIPDEIAARVGLDPAVMPGGATRRRCGSAVAELAASGGGASCGRAARSGANAPRRALAGAAAGGDRRPVSAALAAGRVQPVRAGIGRTRPAAKLAAAARRAAAERGGTPNGDAPQPLLRRS